MTACQGHALIRVYINGHWFLSCVNEGCGYLIREG